MAQGNVEDKKGMQYFNLMEIISFLLSYVL